MTEKQHLAGKRPGKAKRGDKFVDMLAMTVKLIDRTLALDGSYYLPYRLHATREQMRIAYPRLDEFVAAKRRYDPQLRFRNALWDTYLA